MRIQLLQQLIKSGGLETSIELRAAFCLGHCTGCFIGVTNREDRYHRTVQHIFVVILPLVMEEE